MFYRYGPWDGSQEIEPFTPEELMSHIADDILAGGDLNSALRRMMQRGAEFPSGRRMMGLQEMLDRLRERRTRDLQRYNLDGMMDGIKERLDKIVDTERQTVDQRLGQNKPNGDQSQGQPSDSAGGPQDSAGQLAGSRPSGSDGQQGSSGQDSNQGGSPSGAPDPALQELMQNIARRRREQLENLPPDVGGRIKELRDYDFLDPEARQQFDELMQMLQQQMLQNYFKGLQQSIQSMTPEGLKQIQQMVHDLNEMLERRMRGEDPRFDEFMQKWGDFFPDGIENLDQLLDHLQEQMRQMQSLLNSMSPEMRQQLEDMMEELLRDNRIQLDLMQLAANLQALNPMGGEAGEFPFSGDEPLTMQEALRLMGDMNSLDEMERDIIQAARSNNASDIDADELGRLLGEEAKRMLEEMQAMTKMLEEAGLIRRKGKEWELTPSAMRKIGQRALQDIFGKLRESALGDHSLGKGGSGIERLDDTKQYTYGDAFVIDVQKSVMNAVYRQGTGTPVRLKSEDFEVYRTERMTQCSTVIMLDMSYSMMRYGRFEAGRKVALALDTLIRSKFPKDNLYVVAFSYFVLTLKPQMLLDSYWVEYGGGTNFQEALHQARMILGKHKVGTKQIIFITDGEPTTYSYWGGGHDDGWGRGGRGGNLSYGYDGVMAETLREVVRCTRDEITINTFILERDPYPVEFVKLMTKINGGRAFFATPNRLGEYIVFDYMNNKRKAMR